MVKIAVCDDEKETAAGLKRLLIDITADLNIPCTITVYYSAEELRRTVQKAALYDLIYLDITFAKNEIDGVQAGYFIRETLNNHTVSIVYISKIRRHAMRLFDLQPLHFLVKPLLREQVEKTLQLYLKRAEPPGKGRQFSYKKGRVIFTVPLKEIIYFESLDRKVIIHLSGGENDNFYGALKDIYEDQIKEHHFLFIHASYLVNYDYVTAAEYTCLHVSGAASPLPIAKHRRNEIRQQYITITDNRRLG